MTRHARKRWLIGCTLGAAGVLGALTFAPTPGAADPPDSAGVSWPRPLPPGPPAPAPARLAAPEGPPVESIIPAGVAPGPRPTLSLEPPLAAPGADPDEVVTQVGGPPAAAPGRPALSVAPTAPAQPPSLSLMPALTPSRLGFPRGESAPGRKSFVDLTAAPCFGHAPDYNWIIGRVEYSSVGKEWRLRYASVDEVDRFGGRVALIENQHVRYLSDGMYVHVRGHLVNPDNTGASPTFYRIEWFQAVEHPNAPPAAASPQP